MFVFKHAFLNLKRHTWRYLLVGIILFLLILGTVVTSTVYTSAKVFAKNYSKQFMTLVTILEPDLSSLTHEKKLTKEQYLKFGESKYVNGTRMAANFPVSFDTLKTNSESSPLQVQKMDGDEVKENYYPSIASWFGVDTQELKTEFLQGDMEISTGRANLKMNECLISAELAKLNQLKIGDSIQVTVIGNQVPEKKALVIAGIYQPKEQTASKEVNELMRIQGNNIYTNLETVQATKSFEEYGYNNVAYELKNRSDFDAFLKELQKKGLPDEYHVMTNEANMDMLLSPVNGVGTLSGTILLGFMIFGNFSLALFSIRKFKQEQTDIYVLRNIGITKSQLIQSRLIELGVSTIISFSLAFMTARLVTQPIADWQLKNQKQMMGNVAQLFSVMDNGKVESITTIPMILTNYSFVFMIGITSLFLMTIISIEAYKIFKFEPIEFLLERNIDES